MLTFISESLPQEEVIQKKKKSKEAMSQPAPKKYEM
jgi:hypothetical protein